MTTGLVYDPRFLDHDTGPDHPERPDRLRAIVERFRATGQWDRLTHLPVAPADLQWVQRVHQPAYVHRLQAACEIGRPYIDSRDSAISPLSYEVALLAVGGVLGAVDAVMAGQVTSAFCAVRPPGHHAEADRSMGFCLLNNVAIAAEYLLAHHHLARVAIVDFDVHHGNGTQHLFEERREVLFISLHEHPTYLYPGTGFAWEKGRGPGEGQTINLPLPPQSGDDAYRHLFRTRVIPALEAFAPQFLLISAGFDAAADDPLAHLSLTPLGFLWMTHELAAAAHRHAGGRLVSVLEGGYDLRSLAECASLHVQGLLEPPDEDPLMALKAGVG